MHMVNQAKGPDQKREKPMEMNKGGTLKQGLVGRTSNPRRKQTSASPTLVEEHPTNIKLNPKNGERLRDPLMTADHPAMWAITYDQLVDVKNLVHQRVGPRRYRKATMRDVNDLIITPSCLETGVSYARQLNPDGLLLDAFITHAWDEPFVEFVESIEHAFQTTLNKPNLWICAFALVQGDASLIAKQLGTAEDGDKKPSLLETPFVRALQHADRFVVVRNSCVDLYGRIWCVCELLYARQYGLVPEKTYVTGANSFTGVQSTCLNATATSPKDQEVILSVLLNEHNREEIDSFVTTFRSFQSFSKRERHSHKRRQPLEQSQSPMCQRWKRPRVLFGMLALVLLAAVVIIAAVVATTTRNGGDAQVEPPSGSLIRGEQSEVAPSTQGMENITQIPLNGTGSVTNTSTPSLQQSFNQTPTATNSSTFASTPLLPLNASDIFTRSPLVQTSTPVQLPTSFPSISPIGTESTSPTESPSTKLPTPLPTKSSSTNRPTDFPATASPSFSQSAAPGSTGPTSFPSADLSVPQFIDDPNASPQLKAEIWFLYYYSTVLETMPAWRQTQILTLATFFYALAKYIVLEDSTELNLWQNFMASSLSECEWAPINNCEIMGTWCIPVTCNSNGEVTSLHFNKFYTGLWGTLPTEVGLLTQLTNLDLGITSLEGTIPTELGNLSALTFLQLHSTGITGTIPTELGLLTALSTLALYDSNIEGFIPEELGSFAAVGYFFLQNTNLSGTVPIEFCTSHYVFVDCSDSTSIRQVASNAKVLCPTECICYYDLDGSVCL